MSEKRLIYACVHHATAKILDRSPATHILELTLGMYCDKQDMQPANEWQQLKEIFLFDWPLLPDQVDARLPPHTSPFTQNAGTSSSHCHRIPATSQWVVITAPTCTFPSHA